MTLYAEAVRSMRRFDAQVEPQQTLSPQKLLVRGPQSAIEVVTAAPLHRLVVRCRKPHPRRVRPRPHRSGRVMSKQAWEAFGQACWREPELQVPQAPWPVEPHGPQAFPQQNHDISPLTAAISVSFQVSRGRAPDEKIDSCGLACRRFHPEEEN
jgi:hypothetical protein